MLVVLAKLRTQSVHSDHVSVCSFVCLSARPPVCHPYVHWSVGLSGCPTVDRSVPLSLPSCQIRTQCHIVMVFVLQTSLRKALKACIGVVFACCFAYSVYVCIQNPKKFRKMLASLLSVEFLLAFQAMFEGWDIFTESAIQHVMLSSSRILESAGQYSIAR